MREHRITLFGDAHAAELARQVGKVGDFDAGDIVEISRIVGVAANAIGDFADPAGEILHVLMEALPQTGMPAPLCWMMRSPSPATSMALAISKRGGAMVSN